MKPKVDAFLKLVKGLLKEQYYVFSYPLASLLIKNQASQSKNHKATIVFVECWFQKNPYHRKWSAYLEEKGFKTILISFSNMNESFEKTAERLNDYLESMDLKDYILVGISGGAVACLYYLNHYNRWGNIRRFISLAGPLHGTRVAWTISFTRKGRSLIPGNPFLKKLHSSIFPKDKMITVSAQEDELIPLSSSTISGVRSYILPVNGHNVFHLDYKKTYDLIAELSE